METSTILLLCLIAISVAFSVRIEKKVDTAIKDHEGRITSPSNYTQKDGAVYYNSPITGIKTKIRDLMTTVNFDDCVKSTTYDNNKEAKQKFYSKELK